MFKRYIKHIYLPLVINVHKHTMYIEHSFTYTKLTIPANNAGLLSNNLTKKEITILIIGTAHIMTTW